jgi:hypothetical protein
MASAGTPDACPTSLVDPRSLDIGTSVAASPSDAFFEQVLPKVMTMRSVNSLEVRRIRYLSIQTVAA